MSVEIPEPTLLDELAASPQPSPLAEQSFAEANPEGVVRGAPGTAFAEQIEPVKAAPPRDESERLDPTPIELRLQSGSEFSLEPLKLRQFLRLLRIVTRGAADVLDSTTLDFNDPDSFTQTFVGMVLFSIPEAEEESIDFIKSMVKPKNLSGNAKMDLARVQALSDELDNPELEDVVTIVQAVIEREGEDLRALGKRLGAMFKVAEKMGATSPQKQQTAS